MLLQGGRSQAALQLVVLFPEQLALVLLQRHSALPQPQQALELALELGEAAGEVRLLVG